MQQRFTKQAECAWVVLLAIALSACDASFECSTAEEFSATDAPTAPREPMVETQVPTLLGTKAKVQARRSAQPVILTPSLRQSIEYGPRSPLQANDDRLRVITHEYDPLLDQWYATRTDHTASFRIEHVATRVANEFYLSGKARNGDAVVERWVIVPQNGTLVAERPPASSGIGTPFTTPGLVVQVQGAGALIPPAQRTGAAVTTKTELYRGAALNNIEALAVDPDGRFLLALTDGPSGLVRFDLHDASPAGPSFETVLAPTAVPELGQIGRIYPAQHAVSGRMYLMDSAHLPGVFPKDIALMDDDNDGNFDGNFVLSMDEYAQLFPSGSFTDFFVHYR